MRQLALRVTTIAAALFLAGPAVAQNSFTGIPVTGESEAGPFQGTLDIERFVAIGGQVVAVGRLSGAAGPNSFSNLAVAVPVQTHHGKGSPPGAGRGRGAALQTPRGAIAVPAVWDPAVLQGNASARLNPMVVPAQRTTACNVLDLTLGPVDLDLLGLVVNLDVVVLNIEAQPGPGNLLGNLLCAVTGLLDGFNPNLAGQVAGLLNQIAALLAGA